MFRTVVGKNLCFFKPGKARDKNRRKDCIRKDVRIIEKRNWTHKSN